MIGSDTRPKLRSELRIEPVGEDSFQVVDPTTLRRWMFDEMQAAVMRALDGKHSPAEIAAELMGDAEHASVAEAFIRRLDDLCLLEPADADPRALERRQAKALQPESTAKRDGLVQRTVQWAAQAIPFYRERFVGLAEQVRGARDLPLLPTMSKKELRDNFPTRLLPDGVELAELLSRGEARLLSTSGSTGGRLEFVYDNQRNAYPYRFPGIRQIDGGWNAVRIARFTTPICAGFVCHMGGMPYEERLLDEARLTLNSSDRVMSLTRGELDEILSDLDRFKPNILMVDPVYCLSLVRALERNHLPIPRVKAVWTTFEYCSHLHRRALEQAFQAPVSTLLGATDLAGGAAAFQCERGRYHVWDEEYYFEFLREGRSVRPGELGEITVTSHNHRFARVIRYRLGDLGTPVESCDCGYADSPAFLYEGRIQDCMLDTSGRPVTTRAFDDLFEGLSWIDFYRMVQRSRTEYELAAIRRDGASDESAQFLERARGLLGADARVQLRYVRELPAEKSFKYLCTTSQVWSVPQQW